MEDAEWISMSNVSVFLFDTGQGRTKHVVDVDLISQGATCLGRCPQSTCPRSSSRIQRSYL
jgi:hypothetical protein